ncbi:MAG: hypothetical protein GOVbin4685_54 [Prokaryotic dsDNA virus sp.]|jgi:hypothetical protein|nr:MAG: hypothetical protein GOVbin4685_54 [Prokaryotic dsDNA virus sp.]|tara:strand:+ start:2285 stop:2725 length:441 start_codon:yes stop_codon:yes gene_type:complete
MTYTCNICGTDSEKSEFYKGVTSRCKECHKAKVRENRKENAEYYRKYDADRFQNDPKVKQRHRRYQKTDAGKAAMGRARKKWLEANPEKRAAHVLLGSAIKRGDVEKPDVCQECGAGGRIHGHHEDYSKPLEVDWLCATCHAKRHK